MKLVSIDHSGFAAAAILRHREDGTDELLPLHISPADSDDRVPISMRDLLEDWAHWEHELKQRADKEHRRRLDPGVEPSAPRVPARPEDVRVRGSELPRPRRGDGC